MAKVPEQTTHDHSSSSDDSSGDVKGKAKTSYQEDEYPPQSVVVVTMAAMMLTVFLVSLVRHDSFALGFPATNTSIRIVPLSQPPFPS